MIVSAAVPLGLTILMLATSALILTRAPRRSRWRVRAALICGASAAVLPLIGYALAADTSGALWEWSDAGGPLVRASYRVDGIAAIGIAATAAYCASALLAAQRASGHHPVLPWLVLGTGFAAIALALTDDLVAAIVVLAILAALTALAELIVAPPSATARLVAFLVCGIQSYVVAALLVSRRGAASLAFGDIDPATLGPGAVLAATLGSALVAGLYPFVPWRYEGERAPSPERERLRGLLAIPAGIGAIIVLLRLVGASEADLTRLPLPSADLGLWLVVAAALAGMVAALALRRRPSRRGPLLVGGALFVALAAYPLAHWSHVLLAGSMLAIAYVAAVTAALPRQWEIARHDVTLAGLFVAVAIGTPASIAGGLLLLVAGGLTTLLGTIYLPPRGDQLVRSGTATAYVAATLLIGAGILGATDPLTQVLGGLAVVGLLAVFLGNVGRELATIPTLATQGLPAALVGALGTVLLFLLCAEPVTRGLRATLGRPLQTGADALVSAAAIVVFATLLVSLSRTLRPLIPDLGRTVRWSHTVLTATDPVPGVLATFGLLERLATRAAALFAFVERRGGVWLAATLILALLLWAAA